MTRSELREHTFKVVFGKAFDIGAEREEQISRYFKCEEEINESDKEFIENRCRLIDEKLDEIDDLLNERTTGWKTSRMNKVDLAILRLACFELKYDEEIPTGVAINEAVELAKKYSSDEGPAFVNGVLAKLVD
ncbi:MAG: transcription antitermination factor NusB [Eubacteriales bacterium]